MARREPTFLTLAFAAAIGLTFLVEFLVMAPMLVPAPFVNGHPASVLGLLDQADESDGADSDESLDWPPSVAAVLRAPAPRFCSGMTFADRSRIPYWAGLPEHPLRAPPA